MLNVYRYPYSFIGLSGNSADIPLHEKGTGAKPVRGMVGYGTPEGEQPTWAESMRKRGLGDAARPTRPTGESLEELGAPVGIKFNYDVKAQWQPVDSQRVIIWAGRRGKQEAFMSGLSRRHFEEQKSASHRATLLEAAEEAGLDPKEVSAFLDTDELKEEVWKSYRETYENGIFAIPLFVFSRGEKHYAVPGSSDKQIFLQLFEKVLKDFQSEESSSGATAARL